MQVAAALWRLRSAMGLSLLAVVATVPRDGAAETQGPTSPYGWVRSQLQKQLSTAIGGEFKIGRLSLRPLSLEAEFSDVVISIPAPGADPLRAAVPSGRLKLPWSGLANLAAGQIRLAELVLERPSLTVDARFLEAYGSKDEPDRLVDVRIDRLEISGGRFKYSDREIPLEVQTGDLELQGTWGEYRRTLIGQVKFSGTVLHAPLARPLPIRVQSGFRLGAKAMEFFGLEATGASFALDLAGRASWGRSPAFSANGHVAVELAELGEWLEPGFPRLAGKLDGSLSVDRNAGPIHLAGHFSARDARFGPVQASQADADADFRPGRLGLTSLRAAAYGGSVRGRVGIALVEPMGFRVEVAGDGLQLESLLALAGRPLPVAASAHLDLSLGGDPGDRRTWSGSGRLDAVPVESDASRVPVRAIGEFRVHDGLLVVQPSTVELASASLLSDLSLEFSAEPPRGVLRLEGTTSSAAETKRGALMMMQAMGVPTADVLHEPLLGAGPVRARIGLGGVADLDLTLQLSDGSWSGETFDTAELDLSLRGNRLDLHHIGALRADAWMKGAMKLDVEPLELQSLDAEVANLDLKRLLARAGGMPEIEGRITGAVAVSRGFGGLSGDGYVQLRQGLALGERIQQGDARLEVRGGSLLLSDIELHGPAIDAEGSVRFYPREARAEVRVAESHLFLDSLGALSSHGVSASGTASLHGDIEVVKGTPSGELLLTCRDWRLGAEGFQLDQGELGALAGRLRFAADGLGVALATEQPGNWSLEAVVGWSEELPIKAALNVDEIPIDIKLGATSPGSVTLTGRLELEGPLARPRETRVAGSIQTARVRLGAQTLTTRAPVPFWFDAKGLELGEATLVGGDSDLTLHLRIGFDDRIVDAACSGKLDLGVLAALHPGLRGSGPVAIDATVGGTLEHPDMRGALDLQHGRMRVSGFPHSLDDLDVALRLNGQEVRVEGFRGLLGGGELRGAGGATLEGLSVGPYHAEVLGANVQLTYPEGFKGVYDGKLTLDGKGAEARIGGTLNLVRGLYKEEFNLEELLSMRSRKYGAEGSAPLPRNIVLDVDLHADGNVWIRNEIARLESRLDLHLGGELVRPEISGRLWFLEGGTVTFRDVEYDLTSGTLDFLGRDRLNPYLDIRAETHVREYEVFLHVEGTLDRFDYGLTSNPALPQQDIIALLLTGTTFEGATGSTGTGAFTGDLAANYFAGALTGRVGRQLRQVLGLERVQIDPLLVQGQADPTARITLGKRVTDDVSLVYSTDLGTTERPLYQIEWRASKRFRLVTGRNPIGGIGGDVTYSRRLDPGSAKRKKSRTPEPATDSFSSAEDGIVAAVEIVGVGAPDVLQLLKRIPLRAGDRVSRSRLFEGATEIRRFYVHLGRIEARIDLDPGDPGPGEATRVVYRVTPGPEVRVSLEGVGGKERRRLRQRLEAFWAESVYTDDLYAEAQDLLREDFHDRGRYAADVERAVTDTGGVRSVRYVIDPGTPVKVSAVSIEGAVEISEERIRQQMLTRPDSVLTRHLLYKRVLREDVAAIRGLYQDQGFLQATIEPPALRLSAAGDAAAVSLRIQEGPRFTVASIEVPKNLAFPAATLSGWTGLALGSVFSTTKLLEAENALRARLDEAGYPDARVETALELTDGKVLVRFLVELGSLSRVGAVEIQGNERTLEKIIRRELLLAPGDLISREKLLRSQHRLYRLALFSSVHVEFAPMAGEDSSLQVLRVRVEEAPPLAMTLGAGYDSEGGARGSFLITHNNLAGRDRSLSFRARQSGIERRVEVIAKEPRLFSRILPALFDVYLEEQERTGFTVDRKAFAFRVETKPKPSWTNFLRYNYQHVDLSDVVNPEELARQKLSNLKLGDLSYALARDTRDDPFLPRHGGYAGVEVRVFSPLFLSEEAFIKVFLQGSLTHTFSGGAAFGSALRIGAAEPLGDTLEIPISERLFAGGDSTLRGFGRDQVGPQDENGLPLGGEALFLINEQFRFPIWGRLKGVVFYDAGNVYPTLKGADPTDLRHALGAGLHVVTPIGPLRFEYGRKLDRRPGESPAEFFIAIGGPF